MIDKANHSHDLTVEERKFILRRSLNAVPFFQYMPYDVIAGTSRQEQYVAKREVNQDFFLTEQKGNFSDVFDDTNSLFNINIYLASNGRSIYGYNKGQPIPTGQVTTEGRFDTVVGLQKFDDRQRENISYPIRRGETILSEIVNVNPKAANATARLMLSGYTPARYSYITSEVQEAINRSLTRSPNFQIFKFTVDFEGIKYRNIENDNTPRLILGFGVQNGTSQKANIPESYISIEDARRALKWTSERVPLEFIAPRLTCVLDTHIYYLPIEYFFEPFGNLRFQVENIYQDEDFGYEFFALTRTI